MKKAIEKELKKALKKTKEAEVIAFWSTLIFVSILMAFTVTGGL